MSAWADLLARNGSSAARLFAGEIVTDAVSVDDEIEAVADGFDKSHTFGPAPFMPRVDDASSVVLPQKGDRCLIAIAEGAENGDLETWIVGYTSG